MIKYLTAHGYLTCNTPH